MILTSFNDVRHIHLTDKHSANVKTSWYGESIGHYEGDTLVVDTIGLDDRTLVDGFGTPHTKQLHIIERFHLIEDGQVLEANVHVEDPGAFTMPWYAIQRFRQYEAAVRKVPVERNQPGIAIRNRARPPAVWAGRSCPERRSSDSRRRSSPSVGLPVRSPTAQGARWEPLPLPPHIA